MQMYLSSNLSLNECLTQTGLGTGIPKLIVEFKAHILGGTCGIVRMRLTILRQNSH